MNLLVGSGKATYATPICRWAAGEPRSAAAAPATQPKKSTVRNRATAQVNRTYPRQSTTPIHTESKRELTLQSAWYSFWSRLRQLFSAMVEPLPPAHTATAPAETLAATQLGIHSSARGPNPIESNQIRPAPRLIGWRQSS